MRAIIAKYTWAMVTHLIKTRHYRMINIIECSMRVLMTRHLRVEVMRYQIEVLTTSYGIILSNYRINVVMVLVFISNNRVHEFFPTYMMRTNIILVLIPLKELFGSNLRCN